MSVRVGSSPDALASHRSEHQRGALDSDTWGQALSTSLFDCEVEISRPESFAATVTSRSFAGIEFTEVVCSDEHAAYRNRARVNSTDHSSYLAVLQVSGEFRVTQGGRTGILEPGQLCFIDSGQPVTVEASDNFRGVGVKFPNQLLNYPRENLANLTARTVRADQGVASAVCSMLLTLNNKIDTIEPSNQYKMVRGVLDLVEAMLSSVDPLLHASCHPRDGGIAQIKDYIDAHLSDADLNPKEVAAAHYISVRQLHYLFQATDVSMSTWVRERRLENCKADLADPRLKHLSISAIARKWGFPSSSHFGHLFKLDTGLSPRDFRDTHTPAYRTRSRSR
ncbi:AraC-like ligand-binding domain-containing protein [Rhodococcus sp. NPDC004095]